MVSAKNGGYSAVFLWLSLDAVSDANTESTRQDSRAILLKRAGRPPSGVITGLSKRSKTWIRGSYQAGLIALSFGRKRLADAEQQLQRCLMPFAGGVSQGDAHGVQRALCL